MKKVLCILGVISLLIGLLPAMLVPASAAGRDAGDWTLGEGVTFNDQGHMVIPNGQHATLNEAIDFTADNFDVSVTIQGNFTNNQHYIYLYLTKTIPTAAPADGADTFRVRLLVNQSTQMYNFNQSSAGGSNSTGNGGDKTPYDSNTPLTVRFKRENGGNIKMFMNGVDVFTNATVATQRSDYIEGLGSGYLSIQAKGLSFNVLEVNGNTPIYKGPRTEADWTASSGVAFDDNGYMTISNGQYATLNEAIDFTSDSLDASVSFTAPFVSNNQRVAVYLHSGKPTGTPEHDEFAAEVTRNMDGTNPICWLRRSWVDGTSTEAYAGNKGDYVEGAPITISFKRVNDQVKMYVNGSDAYWGSAGGMAEKLNTFGKQTYMSIVVLTDSGAADITATVRAVNGKTPIYVEPRTAQDWTISESAAFNDNGTLALSNGQFATLNEQLDFAAEDLDLSFKVYAPCYNGAQMLSMYLSEAKPSGAPTTGDGVIKIRFYYNPTEGKFALNHTWMDGDVGTGAYAGVKTEYGDGVLTFNFKRVNDIVKLYINGVDVYWGDAAGILAYLSAIDTAYLSLGVESSNGPISMTLLEMDGKKPIDVTETADPHSWTDVALTAETVKFIGRTTTSYVGTSLDWGMSGIEFNFQGTAARVRLNYNHNGGLGNGYMAVYVNGERTQKFAMENGVDWYTLVENGDPNAVTNVRLVKLNEGMLSMADIVDVQIDGALQSKPANKPMSIEVIGDSITAGYGILGGPDDSLTSENEDGAYTYGYLLAEALDADLYTVASSGKGVLVNGDGKTAEVMPALYQLAQYPRDKATAWNTENYHPDMVLVGLGTNDAVGLMLDGVIDDTEKAAFKTAVKAFIEDIKTAHPDAKIVWAYGLMNQTLMDPLREAVQEAANGSKDIIFVALPNQLELVDSYGADTHPTAACNAEVAKLLLAKLTACVKVGDATYDSVQEAINAANGNVVTLLTDMNEDITLNADLYIDLNGFDLSGTVTTNGYAIYGMDSTTEAYTCENIGYFNCVDTQGEAVVPVRYFQSDITGEMKWYMAIADENGYSFHRFYLGITHVSLKPNHMGLGYKSQFYGDEMVIGQMNSFDYHLQLGRYNPVVRSMAAENLYSGRQVTLRINNWDAANYGETELYAYVSLSLADGTVIESHTQTVTLRQIIEDINANYTQYSKDQLLAVVDMINKDETIQSWDVENIIKGSSLIPEDGDDDGLDFDFGDM